VKNTITRMSNLKGNKGIMDIKRKSKRLRHITFNLIDLACLIVSFFIAYFIKFGTLNIFVSLEWPLLLAIICIINVMTSIIERTYIGILKRRYYQQFQKELSLVLTQLAVVSILLFSLKMGAVFSRQMVFTTYIFYFIFGQITKYLRKKFLTGEFSFGKEKRKITVDVKEPLEYDGVDNRSEIHKLASAFVKRAMDILGGIVGCIILIPLMGIVFISNKISEDDDGPLFFTQERIGKDGRLFTMIKFRSMVVDADEKLKQFLEENEDIKREYKIYRKLKDDPRVTHVGKFLRKTSLDEFPQFINVLVGQMSLVGPRPYLEREAKDMGKYFNIIVQHKPGITGLWQISGRSNVSFEERLELDIEYHKTQSVRKDIIILFKTLGHIMKKEGAI